MVANLDAEVWPSGELIWGVELLAQRRHTHERSRSSPAAPPASSVGEWQSIDHRCKPFRRALRTPFQIGQGSIWKSLLHLYAAEFVWLEALLGNDDPLIQGDLPGKLPGNQLGEGGITNLDDLQAKWLALEQRWNGYLALLTPESLDELVYKKSTSYGLGKRYATRRSDVLLHISRTLLNTRWLKFSICSAVGSGYLPDTMLIALARKEAELS